MTEKAGPWSGFFVPVLWFQKDGHGQAEFAHCTGGGNVTGQKPPAKPEIICP
ncbi:hypothetical protein AU14_11570 [Marinobacter similis]|uniref:Uncharacterized protein n=1 Tax=Marinobacter similis TaxID=1420916 RepID=W5YMH2_9GAMM|nr:hypothetical protein AU14_11570 [Marinobacter similis]